MPRVLAVGKRIVVPGVDVASLGVACIGLWSRSFRVSLVTYRRADSESLLKLLNSIRFKLEHRDLNVLQLIDLVQNDLDHALVRAAHPGLGCARNYTEPARLKHYRAIVKLARNCRPHWCRGLAF